MIALRFLLLISIMASSFWACQGQSAQIVDKERQLRLEMDRWMMSYRHEKVSEFDHWLDLVANHTRSVWIHPVYKHMQTFYEQYRDQYLRHRQEDLKRYLPAPEELPGYVLDSDFNLFLEEEDENEDFLFVDRLRMAQDIASFRTLTVADTRSATGVVGGSVWNYLRHKKGIQSERIANDYTYGDKLFANPIKDNKWEITLINRIYTLKYTWDIVSNHISVPELWVYTGEKQQPAWLQDMHPKANTPRRQIFQKIAAFRWALYDQLSEEDSGEYSVVDQANSQKKEFIKTHRQEYMEVRRAALENYPKPDDGRWRDYKQEVPELEEGFLYALGIERSDDKLFLPINISAYDVDGSETTYYFYYIAMRELKNYAEYNLSSWILGQDIYAQQIDKNNWELQYFYRNYALRYRWNIATDELSEIQVGSKD